MKEYTFYKGYYIANKNIAGPSDFTSKTEIDAYIKQRDIEKYQEFIRYFQDKPTTESALFADKQAERLHDIHGLSWEEIEALEISA